jgi:hypothetical protein
MRIRQPILQTALAIALAGACATLPASSEAEVKPPENAAAQVDWNGAKGLLRLEYHGADILEAVVRIRSARGQRDAGEGEVVLTSQTTPGDRVEQRLELRLARTEPGAEIVLAGTVTASEEAFAAETDWQAQKRFPCIRNCVGPSDNLRNHAVYDRKWDWVLIGPPDGQTRIEPRGVSPGATRFAWSSRGAAVELVFRPLFYQKHKRLRYFQPWTYRVRRDSITGWSSWWAYQASFTESDLKEVVRVMAQKRLPDFGYRFLQIDDTYQGGSGTPESWLKWNAKFPGGIDGYAATVRGGGFEPAVWVGVNFRDERVVRGHRPWFVRKADGSPLKAAWVDFGVDATVPEAAAALVRPTYRGFREHGFTYVKIDALRHLLYDSLHNAPEYGRDRGLGGDDVFRRYLAVAREELGPGTFVLACWGVLPEAIGLADGCRLGTDGFGPATLQQYSSWNGVVWRNDPDHCDVLGGSGKVADSILRPTIVSMAGGMLMLSDRPAVYRRDECLQGAKRSSPVLFTVPGQLYDYEPDKADWLLSHRRSEITAGGPSSPMDARPSGNVCPWWLLEIDRPFEHWTVLARYNWTDKPLPETLVPFADLGLARNREYLVYEFWTKKPLGVFRGQFPAEASPPGSVRMYAIRQKLDRPQIVSTNRHISQGGVDLLEATWNAAAKTLSGRSAVVQDDPYEITVCVPEGFKLRNAEMDGRKAAAKQDGRWLTIGFTPRATRPIAWELGFE